MARDVLYWYDARAGQPSEGGYEGLEVVAQRPRATLHDWFWLLFSGGRLERYEVVLEGRAVAWVYCVGRVFQFPFMRRGDICIGPAYTEVAFRGRGYYPALLAYAVHRHWGRGCWMVVAEDNAPSRRGVEKAGFRRVAYLNQNRITKVFKVVERIEERE